MRINRWSLTNVPELRRVLDEIEEWAKANKVHPGTIYINGAIHITLYESTLTDGSKVHDAAFS